MLRKFLLFISSMALCGPVMAASLEARLQRCLQIDESAPRLVCYDDVSRSLPGSSDQSAPMEAAPTSAGAIAAEETALKNTESFGKDHWESEREISSLDSVVAAVQKDAYGKLVVRLDNGQVWRQVKNEKIRVAVNDPIIVERGMLNSFFFVLPDSKRKVRFKRVN